MRCKKLYQEYKRLSDKIESKIRRGFPVPKKWVQDIQKIYVKWEKCIERGKNGKNEKKSKKNEKKA